MHCYEIHEQKSASIKVFFDLEGFYIRIWTYLWDKYSRRILFLKETSPKGVSQLFTVAHYQLYQQACCSIERCVNDVFSDSRPSVFTFTVMSIVFWIDLCLRRRRNEKSSVKKYLHYLERRLERRYTYYTLFSIGEVFLKWFIQYC